MVDKSMQAGLWQWFSSVCSLWHTNKILYLPEASVKKFKFATKFLFTLLTDEFARAVLEFISSVGDMKFVSEPSE